MSDHVVPPTPGIVRLAGGLIRPPSAVTQSTVSWTLTFTPDLTAAETTTLARIVSTLKSAVGISPAEWEAVEPDIANLRAYLGVATPTLVQTAAASKAIIRVLRAMLRD